MSENEHVSNAMDWQHGNEDGYVPSTFALRNAQIEATLALAYEQRTANLIEFYATIPSSAVDKPTRDLRSQIIERLGL